MTQLATETAAVGAEPGTPVAPAGGRSGRRRRRSGLWSVKFIVGIVILAFFAAMSAIGPFIAPYNPSALSSDTLAAPSAQHLLGTTQTGQDVLSQLLVGTGQTLLIGLLAGVIATALAALIGVMSGFLGGASDEGLSLLTNVFLVLPTLPLLIVLTGYLPHGGPIAIAVVISVTSWAWGARILRAQTLSLRRRDYVDAARVSGDRAWRIVVFEILPNERAILASSFLFTVLSAILTQVGLAFLGLVNVSDWNWGVMLYWAQSDDALSSGAWWWFIPPGLCVAILGTGLALANFGLDEFINPRLRTAGRSSGGDSFALTPVRRGNARSGR